MKKNLEKGKNLNKNRDMKNKLNKVNQLTKNNHAEAEMGFSGLVNFGKSMTKGEGSSLVPVSPGESGLGMPYAPEDWPEPGDLWVWRVGIRHNQLSYQDRYLYLPQRLQKLLCRTMPFRSKTSLNSYLKSHFPGTDTSAFFASFVWRIPTNVRSVTPSKGGPSAGKIKSCIVQHKHAHKPRSFKARLDKISPEVAITSPPHLPGDSRNELKCNDSDTQERGELSSNNKFSDYMEIIWGELPEEKKKYSTCLDPCYFFMYGDEASKENVVRWIKKKDVTSKRYVFIPSVERNHWRLFIVCHSDETVESNNKIECMLLLDSLQARQSRHLFEDRLRRLISDVYDIPEKGEKIKEIPLLVPKVPLQKNGRDCGYFVLYYIKLFIESAPELFRRSSYPYFMTKNWFSSQEVERFINTLDQHYKTNTSYQESPDVSADSSSIEVVQAIEVSADPSAVESMQVIDDGISNPQDLLEFRP